MTTDPPVTRIVDPRAVRAVAIDRSSGVAGQPVVMEPIPPGPDGQVLVDGVPSAAWLERHDAIHATLVEGDGEAATRTDVLLLPAESTSGSSVAVWRREVVVDGWQIEIEIESERRASLRERSRRGQEASALGGPTEMHAMIPGRVVAVSIVPGDAVVAGQQLLVVEAMKMQNELRAPRDGVVSNVAVGPGRTIEVGDLLVVLR